MDTLSAGQGRIAYRFTIVARVYIECVCVDMLRIAATTHRDTFVGATDSVLIATGVFRTPTKLHSSNSKYRL